MVIVKSKKLLEGKCVNIIILFIFAAIPPLFYAEQIKNGMLLVSGDGASYFSLRAFFNQQLMSGEFPFWNSHYQGGMPYGTWDSAGLYPIGLLLSFFSPAAFSYAFYFVHLILGAYFFYAFLQQTGCSRRASFIVSVMYETSIHINGLRKSHIMIIILIVWLPVILFFIQKYLNTHKLKFLICSAVIMGIQFCAGFQHTLYTDVCVFFYILVYYIKNKIPVKKCISHYALWLGTYIGTAFAQLYSTMLFLSDISTTGKEHMPYETFTSYSINFVKLLQMMFPYIFGDNVYYAVSSVGSSGLDIEIFLGYFAFIWLLFGIFWLFKDLRIKLYTAFMSVALVYSAMAQIPFLAKIIYHLPLFGETRAPSRALFIFIFFAFCIIAIVLTKIEEKETQKNFMLFGRKFSGAVISMIFTIGIVAIGLSVSETEIIENLTKLQKVFLPAMIISVGFVLLSFVYEKFTSSEKLKKMFAAGLSLMLLISTIIETNEFSAATHGVSNLYYNTENTEIENEIASSGYKLIDAFTGITEAHESIISLNSAAVKGIDGINSYMSFNNPRLYRMLSGSGRMQMNYSGLMTGFPDIENVLANKNDLLSVMGVKYIIDSSSIIEANPYYIASNGTEEEIYRDSNIPALFRPVSEELPWNIYSCPVEVAPLSFYRIEFDIKCEQIPEVLYADVITSAGYDGYNRNITIPEGGGHVSAYYSTGTSTYIDSQIRLIMVNDSDVTISNFTVYGSSESLQDDIQRYDDIVLDPSLPGEYSISVNDVDLRPNTDYLLTFDTCSDISPTWLYADFFGLDYDYPEQQMDITPAAGVVNYSAVINSGDCPSEGITLRFVGECPTPVTVSNISLLDISSRAGKYIHHYSGAEGNIYINPNAKELFFASERIVSVSENENIYANIEEYDLLNTAYVRDYGSDKDYSNANTVITDIAFEGNNASAYVSCSEDTFISFSQCWYKGWRAYVDGVQTPVYIVDDVIMGTAVPAGEHLVEFKYSIPYFGAALFISVGIPIFWIIFFMVKEKGGKVRRRVQQPLEE